MIRANLDGEPAFVAAQRTEPLSLSAASHPTKGAIEMNDETQVAGILGPDADEDEVASTIIHEADGGEVELAKVGTIIPCL